MEIPMKIIDALSIIAAAVGSMGRDTETIQSIRQSSQVKASAARYAENAATDLAVFEEAARFMRKMP